MLLADAGRPIRCSSSRIWAARMGGHGRSDPSGMPRQTSERSTSASLTRATPASQSAKSFASRGTCRKTGRGLSCRDRSWTCLIPTKSSGFPGLEALRQKSTMSLESPTTFTLPSKRAAGVTRYLISSTSAAISAVLFVRYYSANHMPRAATRVPSAFQTTNPPLPSVD